MTIVLMVLRKDSRQYQLQLQANINNSEGVRPTEGPRIAWFILFQALVNVVAGGVCRETASER
eukprot:33760-Eustigmatos_ZCMA.PRE.1